MPRTALKPSFALARLLRARRAELGLSLREVESRSARLGDRIPHPTLRKIEDARQEVGVRRLYTLCRLYDVPLEVVPDLLELDELAAPLPRLTNPDALYAAGRAHWERGEIGPALAALFAMRLLAPRDPSGRLTRQKALLGFAIGACALGRTKLSHRIVEQLLFEGPDPSLLFNVMCQASVTWLRLGSAPMAAAVLDGASRAPGNRTVAETGLLAHQRTKIALATGDLELAAKALGEAKAAYRRGGDRWNGLIVGRLEVRLLLARGEGPAALDAARGLRAVARAQSAAQLACYAAIDEGRALVALERPVEALAVLDEAALEAKVLRDGSAEFYARFWLWKAALAAGEADRAAAERAVAASLAKAVDEITEERLEIAQLSAGRGPSNGPRFRGPKRAGRRAHRR